MSVWYCSRGDVKSALDLAETARDNAQVDRAIEAASRSIEGLLHRTFYPLVTTRYFDWPSNQYSAPFRLWLRQYELVSASTVTTANGTVTIAPADYFLEPANEGPPYDRVELDVSSNAVFGGGDTSQRSVAITGVFGYSVDEVPAGSTAEALDSSETGVDVTDSSVVDVGHVIRVDTERMIVTGRTMITSGQTLQTPLTASNSNTTVAVTTGSSFFVGETILLDSERMLIVDIAGNNLTVKRAWDGSVLATHTGSTIYVPRTLTVERGALGTTAASHLTAAPIYKHVVPGLVRELCIAEAINMLLQESSGYARTVGSGDDQRETVGRGLRDVRVRCYNAYGRQLRSRTV